MKTYVSCPYRDGFEGKLYVPDQTVFQGKALIVAGGGEGIYAVSKYIACQFARMGIPALALAYWNRPGLRDTFTNVPLETVRTAAEFLRNKGIRKIGMWGISKGAEYALLCGSYFPELISAVVAVSPSCACVQGFQFPNRNHLTARPLPGSAFSFEGRPLPYAPTRNVPREVLRKSIQRKTFCSLPTYAESIDRATEKSRIPV